jgi:hypothetical protein
MDLIIHRTLHRIGQHLLFSSTLLLLALLTEIISTQSRYELPKLY